MPDEPTVFDLLSTVSEANAGARPCIVSERYCTVHDLEAVRGRCAIREGYLRTHDLRATQAEIDAEGDETDPGPDAPVDAPEPATDATAPVSADPDGAAELHVAVILNQQRQVIEIEGQAWHLTPTEPGVLGLGPPTFTREEIASRTRAMLDAVVAWADEYGAELPEDATNEAAEDADMRESIAKVHLFENVTKWREVASR